MTLYIVGLRYKTRSHALTIEAEDALIAALKAKHVVQMKISAAAIILFCSVATSFAGDFAPITNNKIAQISCSNNRQIQFDICTRLRGNPLPPPTVGTQQVAPPTVILPHGPNCEADRDFCLQRCSLNPRG